MRWPLAAARPPPLLSDETLALIDRICSRWHVTGLCITVVARPALGILHNAWRTEFRAIGTANASGRPVDNDTLFCIASNSKLFTALAIGLLVRRGAKVPRTGQPLSWSTKVNDIVPGWTLQDGYASEHVDLTDLASHRTGLPRHENAWRDEPIENLIAKLPHLPLSTEVRQHWQYSNLCFEVLAHIVAITSGLPFVEFVEQQVFKPLGMRGATYDQDKVLADANRTDGFMWLQSPSPSPSPSPSGSHSQPQSHSDASDIHSRSPTSCVEAPTPFNIFIRGDMKRMMGAGGIFASARDIAIWLKELLEPQTIPPSVLKTLTTGVIPRSGVPPEAQHGLETYAHGVDVSSYRGHTVWEHGGGIPGQYSQLMVFPDGGCALAVMTNDETHGVAALLAVASTVADALLHLDRSGGIASPLSSWEGTGWPPRNFAQKWARKTTAQAASPTEIPPLPHRPSQPPQRSQALVVEGQYWHAGYGDLRITRLDRSSPIWQHVPEIVSQSERWGICGESTGIDLGGKHTDVSRESRNRDMYYARYHALFNKHILFTHLNGPRFAWTPIVLYPVTGAHGGATDKTVPWVDHGGVAVSREEGLGMFGWTGRGPGVGVMPVSEVDLERTAEAFFTRQRAYDSLGAGH